MDPERRLTPSLSPDFVAILAHISPQQAQPLPSQALVAGDRNLGVDNLAQVSGREAESGTFEKRVVLDETRLGGHVPRGRTSAVPRSCSMPRASMGHPRLGLGLQARLSLGEGGRERTRQRDLPAWSCAGGCGVRSGMGAPGTALGSGGRLGLMLPWVTAVCGNLCFSMASILPGPPVSYLGQETKEM